MANPNVTQKRAGKAGKASHNAVGHLFGQSTKKTGLDADWNQVQPDVLHAIVWAVDSLGGAATFGSTKNGQAYYVKVYIGQPYDAVYFDGDDEGREQMREWGDALVAAAAEHA